jgi:hypothetical protein
MDLAKTFEFKPDIWQFLNSPLFLLIVALIVAAFFILWFVVRHRRKKRREQSEKPKRKMHFRREKKPVPLTEPVKITDERKREVAKDVVSLLPSKQKIEVTREDLAALVNDAVKTAMQQYEIVEEEPIKESFKVESHEQKRHTQYQSEYQQEKKVVAAQSLHPGVIMTVPVEYEADLNGITRKVKGKSDIKDVEQLIDELDEKELAKFEKKVDEAVLKKKEDRDRHRIKEKLRVLSQMSNDEKEQPENVQEKEMPVEQPTTENVEEPKQQPVEQKPQPDEPKPGEELTQRQIIFQMCDKGFDEKKIFEATNYDKGYIKRTYKEWKEREKKRFNDIIGKEKHEEKPVKSVGTVDKKKESQPVAVRYKPSQELIDKVIKHLEQGDKIVIDDGKIYYYGRDKLTYVFLILSIIEAIAVVVLLFT